MISASATSEATATVVMAATTDTGDSAVTADIEDLTTTGIQDSAGTMAIEDVADTRDIGRLATMGIEVSADTMVIERLADTRDIEDPGDTTRDPADTIGIGDTISAMSTMDTVDIGAPTITAVMMAMATKMDMAGDAMQPLRPPQR